MSGTKLVFLLPLLFFCLSVYGRHLEVAEDGKPIIPFPRKCRRYTTLLTLDGGGLKGIITTNILMAVSDHIKTYLQQDQTLLKGINSTFHYDKISHFHIDLADYFHAIAGISAGSWIATYIASKGGNKVASEKVFKQRFIKIKYGYVRPGSLEGLEVFFLEYGTRIYPQAFPFSIARPRFWSLPWKLPALKVAYMTVPAHPVQGLEYTLKQFLGDIKLSEVSTSLLVVAFDLNTRSAMQFVHDKVEPMVFNLRRVYLYRALKVLRASTQRLDALSSEYKGRCTKAIKQDLSQEKNITKEYRQIARTDPVFSGKGKWKSEAHPKFNPETFVGQVKNSVIRRNPKDWTDYANPGMRFSKGIDFYLRDLARASSAFPILHEAKRLVPIQNNGTVDMVIDGAMVGNNPTMQAWIWLMRKQFVAIRDVATLSIGTGSVRRRLDNLATGGALQWTPELIPILLDDSSEFQQSTLNALFFSVIFRAKLKDSQSLRIQVKRESTTKEGRLLQFADNPTSLESFKLMGKETSLEYHWNIKGFVENHIFSGCNPDAPRYDDSIVIRREYLKQLLRGQSDWKKAMNRASKICS